MPANLARPINLIPSQSAFKIKADSAISATRKLSLIVVGIYCLVVLAAGVLFVVFSRQRNNLLAKQNALVSRVKEMEDKESKTVVLKDRMETVSSIFSKSRGQFTSSFLTIKNSAVEGILIKQFSQQEDTVSLSLEIDNVVILENFLDFLSKAPNFKSAIASKIVKKDNKYMVDISLSLGRSNQ